MAQDLDIQKTLNFGLRLALFAALTVSCQLQREPMNGSRQYLQYSSPTDTATLNKAISGDPKSIHRIFQESLRGDLDGEAGEIYAASLLELERQLGRTHFLNALMQETPQVRIAVAQFLLPLVSGDSDLKNSLNTILSTRSDH